MKRTNSTGYPGWRWANFFLRVNYHFWESIFWLGIIIPFFSRFSLRAVVAKEPFYPDKRLDHNSGKIKPEKVPITK